VVSFTCRSSFSMSRTTSNRATPCMLSAKGSHVVRCATRTPLQWHYACQDLAVLRALRPAWP
jgi:hypothetical protein